MQCRYHVGQLGRLHPGFRSAGTEILVILGADRESAGRYADQLHVGFPVLADPDRSVYKLFGLDMALLVIQRTASIVVDRQGIIRYIRRATNTFSWLQESRELESVVAGLS